MREGSRRAIGRSKAARTFFDVSPRQKVAFRPWRTSSQFCHTRNAQNLLVFVA
jgi:hypothetical protein